MRCSSASERRSLSSWASLRRPTSSRVDENRAPDAGAGWMRCDGCSTSTGVRRGTNAWRIGAGRPGPLMLRGSDMVPVRIVRHTACIEGDWTDVLRRGARTWHPARQEPNARETVDMGWDFSTDPDFQAHLDWMKDFVREEIWPLEVLDLPYETLMQAIAPLQDEVKSRGLWAAHLPPELGGQGFGQVKLGLMHEVLGSSVYAPNAFGNQAPDSGNSEILALAGTPEQKERWLHPLLAGDLKSAFSMTEPGAGSDPTLLQTRAVLSEAGDEWVINGHKWFSSNASIADFLIVMAVSDPDARPHQRASMFIVPADTPGVNILRDVPTMEHPWDEFGKYGGHAEILYEDVRIPGDALLGAQGAGFLIAQQRLYPGRIHHCMRWLGVARRAFDMLCERAVSREAHGS